MRQTIAPCSAGLLAVALALAAAPTQAHFIWIDVPVDPQPRVVQVLFNETPEPGDEKLLTKIARTKAWACRAGGQAAELALSPPEGEQAPAALTASLPQNTAQIEAACDYGVYTRAPGGVRLHYFAKCLVAGLQAAPSDRLRLDVTAQPRGEKLAVTVRFDGKPDAAAELLAIDAQGAEQQITLDAAGQAEIDSPAGGRLALRARHVAAEETGERDGQRYAQTWYCSTLVLAAGRLTSPTAAEALTDARQGRALWTDFPGFSADLTVRGDEGVLEAHATIDDDGTVTLSGDPSPLHDWAETQLQSLVQHRMPDGEVTTGRVSFVEEPAPHPLGQLIDLGDSNLQSRYRLKDGVIRQVNRVAGPTRFTISVLAIERNTAGKYLPRAFTMTFWDFASGQLKQSLAYWNTWQHVGTFDLPEQILEVAADASGTKTKELTMRNWRLGNRQPAQIGGR